MRVHIFDVEQGECNIIESPTGHTIMVGSGHNASTGWRPSQWLKDNNISLTSVVLTNLDEDHVSDLPNLTPPYLLTRNFNIDPDWVRQTKQQNGGIGNGVSTAIHWMKNVFTGPMITFNYGIEVLHFYHSPAQFQDTNNLSVLTFISYNGIGIFFPSDIEKVGFEAFLNNPVFINCLGRTNILIAPHHGRKKEYSESVLNLCNKLHAVVISDKPVEHTTQDHDLYSKHASGLLFGKTLRKVLTTRSDGKITVDIPEGQASGSYAVFINQTY